MTRDTMRKCAMLGAVAITFTFLVLSIAIPAHLQDPQRHEARARDELAKLPGLTEILLKQSRYERGLSFSVGIRKGCWIGDWDIIRNEVLASKHQRLLITIEPLSSQTPFDPIVREVSLAALRTGEEVNIALPSVAGLTNFGLFLCKDSTAVGKCASKPAASIEQLTAQYRTSILLQRKPTLQEEPTDKVYFFAYLLVTPDSVRVMNAPFGDDTYQRLASTLEISPTARPEVSEAIARTKEFSRTLESFNLRLENDRLQVVLPEYERTTCNSQRS